MEPPAQSVSLVEDKKPDNDRGPIAWLKQFYRDRPIAFALALIAVSALLIIIGVEMHPTLHW